MVQSDPAFTPQNEHLNSVAEYFAAGTPIGRGTENEKARDAATCSTPPHFLTSSSSISTVTQK